MKCLHALAVIALALLWIAPAAADSFRCDDADNPKDAGLMTPGKAKRVAIEIEIPSGSITRCTATRSKAKISDDKEVCTYHIKSGSINKDRDTIVEVKWPSGGGKCSFTVENDDAHSKKRKETFLYDMKCEQPLACGAVSFASERWTIKLKSK